jgi:hypothetical protein
MSKMFQNCLAKFQEQNYQNTPLAGLIWHLLIRVGLEKP